MKKALVFCGGGGKGAFQIGAWKALREKRVDADFHAVSGVSVGALNAVLFALGDYEQAEKIWHGITYKKILSPNPNRATGLFSQAGLREILLEADLSRLADAKIEVFVTTYNGHKKRNEYHKINDMVVEDMISVLLASSAMPVINEQVEIGGHNHLDGGFVRSGNVPIEPLYENGYTDIWIVSLESNFNIYNITNSVGFRRPSKRIDIKHWYPDCKFEIIQPLWDLGWFIRGTLNFSEKGIRNKMAAGYVDTIKILENEVYCMRNKRNINLAIKMKMEALFKNQRELDDFINFSDFDKVNSEIHTFGGKVFWNNIVELFGWKVQQRGIIFPSRHYRILDHNNVRKAWTTDPEELLRAFEIYEAGGSAGDL
ncbi:MAG: patatin-like phospholipase family protein [Defluviitaleaceae bacterium]|nr:patatin-like phospholipase family protein [Defluviitaleaceae bacterium]